MLGAAAANRVPSAKTPKPATYDSRLPNRSNARETTIEEATAATTKTVIVHA